MEALKLATEIFKRAASEECFVRSRLSELASLLYNTAASVNTWAATGKQLHRGLNPTPGAKLVYRSHLMDRGDGRPLPEVRGQRNGSAYGTPHSGSSSLDHAGLGNGIGGSALNNSTNNNMNNNSNTASNTIGSAFQNASLSNSQNSSSMLGNNSNNTNIQNQPFLGAGTFTDVPVHQAFEATGFMDSNNSNSNMDFLGPVEGVYDAINFPEGILDFYGWGRFFEGSAQSDMGGGGAGDVNNAFGGMQDTTSNNGGL